MAGCAGGLSSRDGIRRPLNISDSAGWTVPAWSGPAAKTTSALLGGAETLNLWRAGSHLAAGNGGYQPHSRGNSPSFSSHAKLAGME
jgi:hypothetical protein